MRETCTSGSVRGGDGDIPTYSAMLALFLNHSPLFVAGEIALGLSLALLIGAPINAIGTERLRGEL